MNHYEIWVNLLPGVDDMEFVGAVRAYLGVFQQEGTLESYTIRRRKFGFGPSELGEWHITMSFRDLAQMDKAFERAATRDASIEVLHAAVYSKVTNYKSGLWRDFPDSFRNS